MGLHRSSVISRLLLLAVLAAAALSLAETSIAATITVTGTGDTVAVDGSVTLREAIQSINGGANINADVVPTGGPYGVGDTINFNISGGCATVCTITLISLPLDTITKPMLIDGYSQSGASVNTLAVGDNAVLKIEIDGTSAGAAAGGIININAGSTTIRGLVINRAGDGNSAIRTAVAGSNVITGNFLGTDPTGTIARGNNVAGVLIAGGNGNTIGGSSPAARNIISANLLNGVDISQPSNGNTVQGNYIGTDASGTAALGNTDDGIEIVNSANNLIGGTAAGAGNVIAANTFRGIFFSDLLATGNTVQGNFIGTNATGTAALGNTLGGVSISNSASNNTIGGTSAGARNVISGNAGFGVEILGNPGAGATGNVIQGNFIGTDVSGASPLGNTGNGIDLIGTASNNSIGGSAAGAGNTIAFNGGIAVGVCTGTGNAVLGNSIFSNVGLGIDLGCGGVTANDPCDVDTGANNLQNFPVITVATSSPGSTNIQGTLNSTASTGPYRIEFFSSPICHTGPPFGEGQVFIGFATPSTDPSCNATFNVTLPVTVSAGSVITATATDPGNNTSEFSQCFTVVLAPTPTITPTITVTNTPTLTPTTGPTTPTNTPTSTPTPGAGAGAVIPVLSPWMLFLLAIALIAAALFAIRRL